jgi:hypothetical protein
VRPWVENVEFPVLIDQQHALTELYAISNVPTVIWIDGDDRIVRPNGVAFGTDTFKDFTGVESAPHMDLIRKWVRDGEAAVLDESVRATVGDLSDDEVRARLHFRIATHLRRTDRAAAAAAHFARAGELAPHDWTIRRATLPLVGDDPFGATFFEIYREWDEAGQPYHGLPGERASS